MTANTKVFVERLEYFLNKDTGARQWWLISGALLYVVVMTLLVSFLAVGESTARWIVGPATFVYGVLYPFARSYFQMQRSAATMNRGTPPLMTMRRGFAFAAPLLVFAVLSRKIEGAIVKGRLAQARSIPDGPERLFAVLDVVQDARAADFIIPRDVQKVAREIATQTVARGGPELAPLIPLVNSIDSPLRFKPRELPRTGPFRLERQVESDDFSTVHALGPFALITTGEPVQVNWLHSYLKLPESQAEVRTGVRDVLSQGLILVFDDFRTQAELPIDYWRADGVVFNRCKVRYDGGPIYLKMVHFFMCEFHGRGRQELINHLKVSSPFAKTIELFDR